MHHATAKRLDRYFENPPLPDYLSLPTDRDPGVLGCSVQQSPAWPAMQAALMLIADQKAADRARQSDVRRQQGTLNIAEDHLESTHEVWIESMTRWCDVHLACWKICSRPCCRIPTRPVLPRRRPRS